MDHQFLLEGLLRCGACGSAMTRAVANGRSETYYYYRCSRKHKTAGQACPTRDVPATAAEEFVLNELAKYVVDQDALQKAVREANSGRDDELAKIQEELRQVETALLQKHKQISKLVDAIEGDDADDVRSIRTRLKEKENEVTALRVQKADLEVRRQVLRRDVLEAEAVAEAYGKMSVLLAEARKRAREDLKALLQGLVDVIEWRPSPEDPKKGTALIELYPLPHFLERGSRERRCRR